MELSLLFYLLKLVKICIEIIQDLVATSIRNEGEKVIY